MERAEALAALVSTARSYWIYRSRTPSVRLPHAGLLESSENPGTILLWPAWALQAALPCFDMGTPENPMCEGTPIHLFAFLFGLVLTAGFYALLYRTILWARRYRS